MFSSVNVTMEVGACGPGRPGLCRLDCQARAGGGLFRYGSASAHAGPGLWGEERSDLAALGRYLRGVGKGLAWRRGSAPCVITRQMLCVLGGLISSMGQELSVAPYRVCVGSCGGDLCLVS